MVVAQLVERSFPTPEIRSSNPNIGKVLSTNCNEIEKEARIGPFKKILMDSLPVTGVSNQG